MVLPKSKNQAGLGNALMNDRFGKGKGSDMRKGNHPANAVARVNHATGETYLTNPSKEAAWVKMRSVTEQGALDEFLSTAELAGTDFTAERMNNVKIIHKDQRNPYLLSGEEERRVRTKMDKNRKRLTVPRRPKWDATTTAAGLDTRERQSLLEWRRGLAELQENDDLLMTPFERNLEVWRQLWRVIERSDLIVQIVDARNPLLFRSEDLENYVKEVDSKKNNLLLVNKADMMTLEQRQVWADYFVRNGINFRFFSAELAKEMNEARDLEDEKTTNAFSALQEEDGEEDDDDVAREASKLELQDKHEDDDQYVEEEEVDAAPKPLEVSEEERTRIITTDELESLFLEHSPDVESEPDSPRRKTTIGLVGYPNVGKSSTINALIGAKKVSVSSTPGKTKHFQTIHLSDSVILCDCPGLVFPNFATTKAELVCNGVLPIDQLREFTGPSALVAQRIPQAFLEALYGMKINTRPLEEGGTGVPTADEMLQGYATARGFSVTGHGGADESRAARYILNDYVKGKLLFCHPPPADPPIDGKYFNRTLYDSDHLPQKRRFALASQAEASMTGNSDDPSLMDDDDMIPLPTVEGPKTKGMDKQFFKPKGTGDAGHLSSPFQINKGKELTGRKMKAMIALEQGIDPSEVKMNKKDVYKAQKQMRKGQGFGT